MSNIVITPTMNQFSGMNVGFNQRFYANNLQEIYIPQTDADIADAVSTVIQKYGKDFSIHSGGHCYENFVYNDSVKAVIDLSTFNAVGKKSDTGQYYIESGAGNWDATKILHHKYGVCLPAGSCYSVGSGGYICGGGYGLLSRLHGLSVDWLSAVDVVCIRAGSAQMYHASATSDTDELKDLFWAHTGGGGGSFGVIVRYYFEKLPPVPKEAGITIYAIDWDDISSLDKFENILNSYVKWIGDISDIPVVFSLGKFMHKSAGQIAFVVQAVSEDTLSTDRNLKYVKELEKALSNVVPLSTVRIPIVGHPVSMSTPSSTTQSLPWIDAVQTLNGSGDNECGKYKSAYMKDGFPPEQAKAMYNALIQDVTAPHTTIDMSKSLVQIDSYGGAINKVASDKTAIPQRSSIMKLQYQTYWKDYLKDLAYPQERSVAHLKWIRDFYSNVYASTEGVPEPNDVTDGCYFNYPDVDLGEGSTKVKALKLYFKENLQRLVTTKAYWDADDYFHHGQSIPTSLK